MSSAGGLPGRSNDSIIRQTTSGCFLVLDRRSRRRERAPIIDETTNRIGDRVQRLERIRIQLRLRALGVQRDCAAVVALGPERHNDQRPNPECPEVKVVVRRKDAAAAMRRARHDEDLGRDRLPPARAVARGTRTRADRTSAHCRRQRSSRAGLKARRGGHLRAPVHRPAVTARREADPRAVLTSSGSVGHRHLVPLAQYEDGDSHVLEKPRLP